MAFRIDNYLGRLGIGRVSPTVEGLAMLQQAQMRAIPFENIDVLLGKVPDLAEGAVWAKLIEARRGGYCFELNKLFGLALDSLGFAARPIFCRVRMGAPIGGPRTHQAFIVTIDGAEWLADSGFGGPGPIRPVRLDSREPQAAGESLFRLTPDDASGELVLERQDGEGWFALYGIDFAVALPADFEGGNFICARWDQSPFPKMLMMNLLTKDGRTSLLNTELKRVSGNNVESSSLESRQQFESVLTDLFGLSLPGEAIDRVWVKIAG